VSNLESETDIIVIGSGFAGLASAIEASEAGASVIVLEKMLAPGGNSAISDGGIAAPCTEYQEKAGIVDSPELMYQDMITAGEALNYPELVKVVTEGAKNAFLWSKDYLGVKYLDRVDIFGGHSVARCYTPESVSGRTLIKKQAARLKELKVSIRTGCYVKTLLQDEAGRINGVQIIKGYRYNNPGQGSEETIYAAKGVIVASGGFGSDLAFRQAQDPRLNSALLSTNKPSATAEILKECLRIGANPVQLSRIQLGPWTSPDEKGYGDGPLFGDYVVIPYGLIIDPETGERFVNELSNRKKLADTMLQRNHPVIGIADSAGIQNAGWDLARVIKKGVIKTFNSISDLAVSYKIKAAALEKTVKRFNGFVRSNKDTDFEKPFPPAARPLEQPPFYAMRMWPKVHYTMGGIQIDRSTRVINRDQHPIAGLYAAGELTGGIHGACRLGSCSITECLVFGRISGKTAVSQNT